MFSGRLPATLVPNSLAAEVARRRAAGLAYTDLTLSNPTMAGFEYPAGLLDSLADRAALTYDPAPLGLAPARTAVSADYARRGVAVPPDRIVLTASSSESYSLLFKLLCDPGDAVLVPVPSYPLFEHLGALDGVTIRPYALEYHDRWTLDPAAVVRAADARTRAVLVVSPNNPTGSRLRRGELDKLAEFCAERGIVLVGDEVFADYPIVPAPDAVESIVAADACLMVALGGLSKSIGLPQVKLGWMALNGPASLVSDALGRLEVIADTYLSVSTPVQLAVSRLLHGGAAVRRQIADRIRLNDAILRRVAEGRPAYRVLPAEAGWSAVVQVPAIMDDEALALALLSEANVLVHPGFFFDFPRDGFLVVSLLVEPGSFRVGLDRMFAALERLRVG